ncbi:MAG: malate dehydrogenase [Abditibacteriota bacterium]|nr:malate dehydrogenase [Abditibacteriota bacterium]
MNKPIKLTITGAAGKIGYDLLFRIAAGNLFGPDRQVEFRLMDLAREDIQKKLTGISKELEDCAFPAVAGVTVTGDPREAFDGSEVVFLVGSKPRTAGMTRKDLLSDNGKIFKEQGKALNDVASRNVKVLVVGNPANTNCFIAIKNAPDLDKSCFSAMLRLDHNRSIGQIAKKLGINPGEIRKMTVWGNHSSTQVPDISYCENNGGRIEGQIDKEWQRNEFTPLIRNRGTEIIALCGASSVGSAANAALCQMRNWYSGTPEDDWVTMGVPSDGSYGIPEGYVYGFPVTCKDGKYSIVKGLEPDEYIKKCMMLSFEEIREEADMAQELLN